MRSQFDDQFRPAMDQMFSLMGATEEIHASARPVASLHYVVKTRQVVEPVEVIIPPDNIVDTVHEHGRDRVRRKQVIVRRPCGKVPLGEVDAQLQLFGVHWSVEHVESESDTALRLSLVRNERIQRTRPNLIRNE